MKVLSTYRIQLRCGVSLRTVRRLLPYLRELGASHVYSSPLLQAREQSTHGYDCIDPTRVDPALGGSKELARLVGDLRRREMGLVLDFAPNHLAATPENPFFHDVLAHGAASRFAPWFDVDWTEGGTRKPRILLPALDAPLESVIARRGLRLVRSGGSIGLRHHDRTFPLAPPSVSRVLRGACAMLARSGASREATKLEGALEDLGREAADREDRGKASGGRSKLARMISGSPRVARAVDAALRAYERGDPGRRRLARLAREQHYRLADWRTARHRLNYRRFFDINELVGIRVEEPEVFEGIHSEVLSWVRDGWLDGLRIDHIDGLLDPRQYLQRLRDAVEGRLRPAQQKDFILLVEKILAPEERLPRDWPVEGTTGYEFLNQVEDALIHPRGAARVEEIWRRFTGLRRSYRQGALAAKRQVLHSLLRADVNRIVRRLATPEVPTRELREAVIELVARLPVYRTYASRSGALRAADRLLLDRTMKGVRAHRGVSDRAARRIQRLLRGGAPWLLQPLQQLSGPAAAKGIEDTVFYRHVPLLSRNEVGGEPDTRVEGAVARLHAANGERARLWPRTLLATTTHDTKRSGDVRARLDVLSECPEEWAAAVRRWSRWNRHHRVRVGRGLLPERNTEYLIYQTLVGVWPIDGPSRGRLASSRNRTELRGRVDVYVEKAIREAKLHTSWIDPAPEYEAAVKGFVRALFCSRSPFLQDLSAFVARIGRPGLWNALARTLVHLTAPGVPDVYQGDELWNFALVDPDNRRPVDFVARRRLLAAMDRAMQRKGRHRDAWVRRLAAEPEDGRVKLHVVARALRARRRHPELFLRGDYVPLEVRGSAADHVIAYLRRLPGSMLLAAVPRLALTLVGDAARPPVGREVWGDTSLLVPASGGLPPLRSVLTGERVRLPSAASGRVEVPLAALLDRFPVALLLGADRCGRAE